MPIRTPVSITDIHGKLSLGLWTADYGAEGFIHDVLAYCGVRRIRRAALTGNAVISFADVLEPATGCEDTQVLFRMTFP
jgi:hypothetical protein